MEELVRGEDGDTNVAAFVPTNVRLSLLHAGQVVLVEFAVALRSADDDVAVRDDVLAEDPVDEDRGVEVREGATRPQQLGHLLVEAREERLGDEVVRPRRYAVDVFSRDPEHLVSDAQEAA